SCRAVRRAVPAGMGMARRLLGRVVAGDSHLLRPPQGRRFGDLSRGESPSRGGRTKGLDPRDLPPENPADHRARVAARPRRSGRGLCGQQLSHDVPADRARPVRVRRRRLRALQQPRRLPGLHRARLSQRSRRPTNDLPAVRHRLHSRGFVLSLRAARQLGMDAAAGRRRLRVLSVRDLRVVRSVLLGAVPDRDTRERTVVRLQLRKSRDVHLHPRRRAGRRVHAAERRDDDHGDRRSLVRDRRDPASSGDRRPRSRDRRREGLIRRLTWSNRMTEQETLLLRLKLENQLAEYWHDVDTNWGRNAGRYYTEDAVFDGGEAVYRGRAKIEEFYAWRLNRGPRVAVHAYTNFRLEMESDDRAVCTWYLLLYAADGVPVLPTHPPINIALVTDEV